MSERTKKCPRCGEAKPASEFYADKSRLDGLFNKCKVCERARQLAAIHRKQKTIAASITPEEFAKRIDFRAEPDGVGGYHYRLDEKGLLKKGVSRTRGYQLMSKFINGSSLPDPVEFWCWDEFPWCINTDHATLHDELPQYVLDGSDEGSQYEVEDSFQIGDSTMTRAAQLHALNNSEAMEFYTSPLDRKANAILRKAGSTQKGLARKDGSYD